MLAYDKYPKILYILTDFFFGVYMQLKVTVNVHRNLNTHPSFHKGWVWNPLENFFQILTVLFLQYGGFENCVGSKATP